jgi:hypothetical protein
MFFARYVGHVNNRSGCSHCGYLLQDPENLYSDIKLSKISGWFLSNTKYFQICVCWNLVRWMIKIVYASFYELYGLKGTSMLKAQAFSV